VNELEAKQLWDYYKFRVPFDTYIELIRSGSIPESLSLEAADVVWEMENESTTDERKREILETLLERISGRFSP
jgi:hypothetical protein